MKNILLIASLAAFAACVGPPVDETSEDIGTSWTCSQQCSATSACGKWCLDDTTGAGTSCGAHGVCVACDSTCTTAQSCELSCLDNGALTDCHGAGDQCNTCSAATCGADGCGAYCMDQPVIGRALIGGTLNSYERCATIGAAAGDKDSDGLPDALEDALARRFLPHIYLSGDTPANNWNQFYGTAPAGITDPLVRMPYVVRKVPPLIGAKAGWCAQGQCAEIIYALPDNWDTGMPDTGWESHRGDSEHVALLVAYKRADDESNGGNWGVDWSVAQTDATAWRMVGAYYSAHGCSSVDSSKFVWPYINGTYSQTGLKNVYISDGKHASYQTKSECDTLGSLFDQCPSPFDVRGEVLAKLFNIGDADGASDNATGYVCPGFEHTIAAPGVLASSVPIQSPPYDMWSGKSFGSSSATAYSVWMRAGSIDWGNSSYDCP